MSIAGPGTHENSIPALPSLFPPGMFNPAGKEGERSAYRAIQIIERLIRELALIGAVHLRHALLQSLPRFDSAGDPSFVRKYLEAILPNWYQGLAQLLDDAEAELFLKLSLVGHERWGKADGIGEFIAAFLEQACHEPLQVVVPPLRPETREIPKDVRSYLGNPAGRSVLGRDFVPGEILLSRPRTLEVLVGPVTQSQLQIFQSAGWADGTSGGAKLHQLVRAILPYYMDISVLFLVERRGFILGSVILNDGRLGELPGEARDAVQQEPVYG